MLKLAVLLLCGVLACQIRVCYGVANLVLLTDAVKDGAACLDGSPPAYYYRQGSGDSAKKWIVHLEGGGWCYNEDQCVGRSKMSLGSSKSYGPTATLGGILSAQSDVNPDFYNWNMAYVKYCDGASFAGNVDKPQNISGTMLYFRGFKNLQAVLKSLQTKGSSQAEEFILTGCSAGGLAVYLHADSVHLSLPLASTKYAAIPDAGYFLDAPNTKGEMYIRGQYQYVYKMQNCSSGVNQDCITSYSADEQWKCFMAQYTYPHIKSLIFPVNSLYDTWQLGNILQLGCTPPHCDPEQMKAFENYRSVFLNASQSMISSKTNGEFLDSCLKHCQTLDNTTLNKVKVDGQTFRETLEYWYGDKSGGKHGVVDCAYPCNQSC